MHMIGEIVENELKNAFELKDEQSLHRGITYLIDSIPHKEQNEAQHEQFRQAVLKMDAKTDAILFKMDEGFKRMDQRFESMQKQMDERFEASDKRFDDNSKKFTMMFSFMTIGFVLLATLMSIYQFIS